MDVLFSGVSKRFGWGSRAKQALSNVTWSVAAGGVTGIVGPNGAGKSTALRILLSIYSADSGVVEIDGGTVNNDSQTFRNAIGYLAEERALYKTGRVRETIAYFGVLKGMRRREALKQADILIERFDLGEYRSKQNRALSKGLSQRAQLASCMIHRPRLLVLDEPFSGLDVVTVATLRGLLAELKAQGTSIVLCSHQMKEVEALAENVVMLKGGKIVLSGTLPEIRRRYRSNGVYVDTDVSLSRFASVGSESNTSTGKKVFLRDGSELSDLLRDIATAGLDVARIEREHRSLEDIFCELVREES